MSILFKNSNYHRHPAFGQMLEISLCCYVKGLELGHKDIYIEWQDTRFLWSDKGTCVGGFKIPNSERLPFKFVSREESLIVDETIDIGKPNSLYEGCESIITQTGCRVNPCQIYIKEYIDKYGEIPKIIIKSSNSYKPFILLHFRNSPKTNQQIGNINFESYLNIIRYIKRNNKFEIYKIGEQSRLDAYCDKIYNYFLNDISLYFELVDNCSLYIGPPSGPWIVPIYFRKPIIALIKDNYVYEREMRGIGKILTDNQKMLLVKDNYKKIKEIINTL